MDGLLTYAETDALPGLADRVRALEVLPQLRQLAVVTEAPSELRLVDLAPVVEAMAELQPVAQLANLVARSLNDLQQRLSAMLTEWADVHAQVASFFSKMDSALQHVDGAVRGRARGTTVLRPRQAPPDVTDRLGTRLSRQRLPRLSKRSCWPPSWAPPTAGSKAFSAARAAIRCVRPTLRADRRANDRSGV